MDPAIQPQADFDLLFLVEALRAMGENKALLLQILQGDFEHLEWWSEEELP